MEWLKIVVVTLIVLAAWYTVIPDFLLHRLGVGSWKRQYTWGVALTFDDGPNPEITPHILNILAEYKVTACFFVTGANAAKYPWLIKEIISQGHLVGAHSTRHKYAWFTSPLATWRDWEQCVATLEELTGRPVEWVRPPWGTFNAVTWLWLKFRHKRAVLWNVEGRDWLSSRSPDQIADAVVNRVTEGSVIVLHDAGGEQGATRNTLAALPVICQRIIEDKKLPLLPLEFLPWTWWRRVIHRGWQHWEEYFAKRYRVERINSTNLLRLATTCYSGPPLYAEDGRLLAAPGDTVAEIHLDSARFQGLGLDLQKVSIRVVRRMRESLPQLARYVTENPAYQDIQVFLGLSLITRGVKGFGFQVTEIPPTLFSRGVGLLQKTVRWIYSPVRRKRANGRDSQQPQLVWISRQQLLEKWLV